MKLMEFFRYGDEGFEQDKSYDPEQDISILDKNDTRKTRLTLKDINKRTKQYLSRKCMELKQQTII